MMIDADIQAMAPMVDSNRPTLAGNLTGEFLASALERNPLYPRMNAALMRRADMSVCECIESVVALLGDLGFDPDDIREYRAAALESFRAALPRAVDRPARIH